MPGSLALRAVTSTQQGHACGRIPPPRGERRVKERWVMVAAVYLPPSYPWFSGKCGLVHGTMDCDLDDYSVPQAKSQNLHSWLVLWVVTQRQRLAKWIEPYLLFIWDEGENGLCKTSACAPQCRLEYARGGVQQPLVLVGGGAQTSAQVVGVRPYSVLLRDIPSLAAPLQLEQLCADIQAPG